MHIESISVMSMHNVTASDTLSGVLVGMLGTNFMFVFVTRGVSESWVGMFGNYYFCTIIIHSLCCI